MAARLNVIDRAIDAIAPAWAAQRAKARAQMQLLDNFQALTGTGIDDPGVGGGTPLLRRWSSGISARDAAGDSLYALRMQRGQIRELVRTNPIATGAINTNVDRVVGTGLALVAQPNRHVLGWSEEQALAWKRTTQTEFSLWADSPACDWDCEQNFYDKQGLTLRSALESGDSFTLMPDGPTSREQPYALRLQTLEADRVGNENGGANTALIAGGIRRGQAGMPKSVFVYDSHPGAVFTAPGKGRFTGNWVETVGPSGRRRILHHFRQLRPEQPRGIPYLAPVIDCLKQLGRYTEAEIQAAVVSAFFTMAIESDTTPNPAPVFSGAVSTDPSDPIVEMGPGAVIGLAKGEKATFGDPSRPNSAFEAFVKAIVQQIGMGLGIPFELLLKQFNASYSASKAALLDAWMWFRSQRTWLARSFCQPVYETWLAEAVATGRIAAPGFFADPVMRWAYSRADWHGDSQGSINPKDEVAAYSAAVDARLMTRERAEWELFGSDWYETFDAKKTENDMLAAANLLPVPKAGAAGPVAAPDAPPEETEPQKPAGAAAEPQKLEVHAHVHMPEGMVHAESHTHLPEGLVQLEAHTHLPEAMVQLDAHITTPDIRIAVEQPQIDVHGAAPTVVIQPAQATKSVTTVTKRDDSSELLQTETITKPI